MLKRRKLINVKLLQTNIFIGKDFLIYSYTAASPHYSTDKDLSQHIMFWTNFTNTSLFILSLRSRLLQEVEGLETKEIERVSSLHACVCQHVLPNDEHAFLCEG